MITGLNHFNVESSNLAAATEFYAKLGLIKGNRPDFPDRGVWMYLDGKPYVHINYKEEPSAPGCIGHVAFTVKGTLNNWGAKLKRSKIPFEVYPEVEGAPRQIYCYGPSGEMVEFTFA